MLEPSTTATTAHCSAPAPISVPACATHHLLKNPAVGGIPIIESPATVNAPIVSGIVLPSLVKPSTDDSPVR